MGWYGPVFLHTSCPYDVMECVSGCRGSSNHRYASVTPLPDTVDEDEFEYVEDFGSGFEDEMKIEN